MNILYFCSKITPRAERFALQSKALGHKIILCLNHEGTLSLTSKDDYFKILYHDGTIDSIVQCYVSALQHNPILLHLFIEYSTHSIGTIITKISKLPTIGDSYDMINAQYLETTYRYKKDHQNEKSWISACKGFTLRSPYYKTLKKIRPNIPFILLPEPFRDLNESPYPRKLRAFDDRIHLIYVIDFALEKGNSHYLEQILKSVKSLKYTVYILEWPTIKTPQNTKNKLLSSYRNIQFIPFLPYNDFLHFLSKCDIVIQCTDLADMIKEHEIYKKETAPYLFSNKYIDAIEVNTPFMFPKLQKFAISYTQRVQNCFYFTQDNLADPAFWKNIKHKIEDNDTHTDYIKLQKKMRRDRERLNKFYKQIAEIK